MCYISKNYTWAECIMFFRIAQMGLSIIAFVLGIFLVLNPRKMIDFQIALYRPFNWRIEPISMEKEEKNTRFMGFVLIIFSVISTVLLIIDTGVIG